MTCSNIVWSNWNQTIYRHRYAYQIAAYRTQANKDRSRLVASPQAIILKHIFQAFFVWKSESQNRNFWIVRAPFIGCEYCIQLNPFFSNQIGDYPIDIFFALIQTMFFEINCERNWMIWFSEITALCQTKLPSFLQLFWVTKC